VQEALVVPFATDLKRLAKKALAREEFVPLARAQVLTQEIGNVCWQAWALQDSSHPGDAIGREGVLTTASKTAIDERETQVASAASRSSTSSSARSPTDAVFGNGGM
jgi:hypothetical protein